MNTDTTELTPAPQGGETQRGLVGKVFDWRPNRVWQKSLIVIVLVLPLIVGITYMWSMWDPSHYLRDVRIALVNQDEGTEQNGDQVNYGDQVADGLLDTDYLNITVLEPEEASEGLRDGGYMFVVNIPSDFSADIVSVIDENPQQAEVDITYNDYVGTNQPLLTASLVPLIQQGVAASIAQGYGEQILDGMNQLSDGLREAADGSVLLDDGAIQLDDGATLLHDGTTQGLDGTLQLRDGAAQLKDGTEQLRDGLNQLRDGTGQLGDGMVQIDDGVGQLTGTLIPLLQKVQQLAAPLQQALSLMERVGLSDQAAQIRETLSMIDSSNPENLASQLQKLKDGTAEVRYNLTDPSAPYLSGVIQLQDGSVQLDDGMGQLYDGTQQLYDGTIQLNDGTAQLKDGTVQLRDGTGQLRTGLTEGAAQAPTIANVDQSAAQIAAPVAFVEDNLHPVQTIVNAADPSVKQLSDGVSMILVLTFGFVLMAVAFLLAPNVSRKARQTHPLRSVLRVCGISTAVNFILLLLLGWASASFGWSPQNKLAMGVTLLAMAFCAAALFQAFRSIFGRLVGGLFSFGVVGYGVLVYGGVWPLDITPPFLRIFHWLSPMTYARYAFMRSVEDAIDGRYWVGILGLLIIGAVALAISLWLRSLRFRGKLRERTDLVNFDREVEAKSREKARRKAAKAGNAEEAEVEAANIV